MAHDSLQTRLQYGNIAPREMPQKRPIVPQKRPSAYESLREVLSPNRASLLHGGVTF